MGNCLSKDPGHPVEEPSGTTAAAGQDKAVTDGKSNTKGKTTSKGPNKILSERQVAEIKEDTINPEKAAAMLDMGIQVIDLFQKAAKATEMVIPSPLGDLLEKVTSVLEVLKVSLSINPHI